MIKEAFKMACVQYKPSGVPFRGNNFQRAALIEIKESVLMDSWLTAIQEINYYKDIYGGMGTQNDKFKFLQSLQDKLNRISTDKDLIKDQFHG
jgi:acyl carrier protein phosphodiesterase